MVCWRGTAPTMRMPNVVAVEAAAVVDRAAMTDGDAVGVGDRRNGGSGGSGGSGSGGSGSGGSGNDD